MLKFNVHTSGLDSLREKVSSASDKAAHIVAMQVRKDTSPYVPALTGSLAKRTRVDGAKSSIRAHTPDICILGS